MYIERSDITWHCITYSYALTVFIVPLAYLLDANKEKNRILILLFEIPAIGVIFCIALASNQGNITSMYIIPMAEQEAVMPDHKARTIFTERFLASDGPAMGMQ